MRAWLRNLSLRNKLTFAALAVEATLLALLIANGVRLYRVELTTQASASAHVLAHALEAALAPPLAQRDDAGVRDMLEALGKNGAFRMVQVEDRNGRVVFQSGGGVGAADIALTHPIELAGERYGRLHLVLSGEPVAAARARYLQESLVIAALALVLTAVLLYGAAGWVTRRLDALNRASQSLASGNLHIKLPQDSDDEIGQAMRVFNQMAQAVRESVERARENENRFHAIADYTYDLEFWLSPDGRLLWINPSVERMLGYTVGECMAHLDFPLDVIHPDDRDAAAFQLRQALRGTSGQGYVVRACRKGGGYFWAVLNWQPIHDLDGSYQGIRASIHDIDDLKATEASLRDALAELRQAEHLQTQYLRESEQERARLLSLLSAMNLGILFVAADGRVIYHNPAFNRIWLIEDESDLIGLPVNEVLAKSPSSLARPDHFSRHLLSVLETREVSDSFEIQMTDGRVVTELDYPVRDQEGRFIGHLWIYEDITRERQTAEQLVYLAERDALTGLYNRHHFQQELMRALLEAERNRARCAVMFFDLDEFKTINDSYGHRAGDALLIRVAAEINSLVRKNEVLARLGGDEFAILLPTVQSNEAEALAERIVRAVAQIPFRFEGQSLRLTTSLGIAYFPAHAADADELVARADIAMYQAKEAGKNAWRVYRADLDADLEMRARLSWGERISNALERGLLRLHFQGVYHARDGGLSHLEALLRMADEQNPDVLIMPGHFIPVAEKNGRIVDIDRWVIREVLQLLAMNPRIPAIAVNLSGRSLSEPDLPNFIADALRASGVNPRRLIVEITETAAVSDLHDAQRLIEALHQLGCGVCLDDFGVGFASFAYLKHLRVDTIKIDGLFIRDLYVDTDNQIFVRAMVDVARGLGKTVVAEYVEDGRVLALLNQFGVDLVQGYHLDRPSADHPALSG
jgi:diguanylate cyclase (GGDEF)-like protein/PAS domain S-box-containing protein